ncbi:hypothetical protein DOY81_000441, partial [Sarcophaga bullata]
INKLIIFPVVATIIYTQIFKMYFTKLFFIFAIVLAMYCNLSEAGQQATKVVGGAIKNGGKKLPPVIVAGYASNSTLNVHVNTKPTSRPNSPKQG